MLTQIERRENILFHRNLPYDLTEHSSFITWLASTRTSQDSCTQREENTGYNKLLKKCPAEITCLVQIRTKRLFYDDAEHYGTASRTAALYSGCPGLRFCLETDCAEFFCAFSWPLCCVARVVSQTVP